MTRILSENDDLSEETIKSLKLALKNSKIYCRNVYKNLDELEQAINENTKDYISISFHDAVMLKSKKNSYEFGLNLQEIMTNQRILVTGVLVRKANDSDVLIDVLNELKLSFEILKELNMKYGKMMNCSILKIYLIMQFSSAMQVISPKKTLKQHVSMTWKSL